MVQDAYELTISRVLSPIRDCLCWLMTGIPGRLSTGRVLQDIRRWGREAHRRHVSVVTDNRRFSRPTERRPDRRGQVPARLPESAHIRVEGRRIYRHHVWERPGLRHAWVQREWHSGSGICALCMTLNTSGLGDGRLGPRDGFRDSQFRETERACVTILKKRFF